MSTRRMNSKAKDLLTLERRGSTDFNTGDFMDERTVFTATEFVTKVESAQKHPNTLSSKPKKSQL